MDNFDFVDVSDSKNEEILVDTSPDSSINNKKKDKFMTIIYILIIILILLTTIIYFFGYELFKPLIKV